MSLRGILIYCLRAGAFAGAVCGAFALLCLILRRRLRLRRLAGIAYLAALIQITALRGGTDVSGLLRAIREPPQLVPLRTTLEALRAGLWPLVYHAAGNMIWFMPLGWMLHRRGLKTALITGMAVSAGIELSQYLLTTGAADIDDLILNTLGAAAGYLLCRAMRRKEQCD